MYTSQEGDLYLGQARALGAEGVLPKQIKQADVTKMLFQLRLVSERRGDREQSTLTRLGASSDLLPANEAAMDMAIIVPMQPAGPTAAPAASATGRDAAPATEVARMLPQLSLEIRAALDTSLRKELAELRGFLGTALDGHAERLQGDLATLLPPSRVPDVDMPTMIAERRPWSAIAGWSFALVAAGCAAFATWLWWNQGGEIAALRTDLAAAYAEAESLRARPPVVSSPTPVEAPAVSPEMLAADGVPPEGSAPVTTPDPALAAPAAAPASAAPSASAVPAAAALSAAAPASLPAPTSASAPAPASAVAAAPVPAVSASAPPTAAHPAQAQ
jgi:hypothetical protein